MATAGSVVVNLIANTGNFIKGMNISTKKLSQFQKSFLSVKSILTSGAIGYAVKGIADGFTDAHKAIREGESALRAFTSALPVVGGIHDSFLNLYMEVSGLTEQLDKLNAALKLTSKLDELFLRNARGREATALEKELILLDQIKTAMQDAGLLMPNFNKLRNDSIEYYRNLEAGESKRKKQLEETRKIEQQIQAQRDVVSYFRKTMLELDAELNSADKWESMLKSMGGILDAEQWQQAKQFIDQIRMLESQIEAKKAAGSVPESAQPFSFKPGAREIDSSMVSVSGLAMQGKEYNYEKKQVDLLQAIARNTGRTANQEVLN